MTTIIAGFAPFPGAPLNPSGDLCEALSRREGADGLHAMVLPVAWDKSWSTLRETIETVKPTSVVLFGLHLKCERLRLELVAQNMRELGREDALGRFPAGPSILDGPERYHSKLPWSDVAKILRNVDLDFEWSNNAGAYLCNDTLFRLAHHADELGVTNFGFVHVPMSDERIAAFIEGGSDLPQVFNTISAEKLETFAVALARHLNSSERRSGTHSPIPAT